MKSTSYSLQLRLVFFTLLIFSTSSCFNPFIRFSRRTDEPQPPGKEKYVHKFVAREFDLTTNIGKLARQFLEELNRENFAWIEQQAAQARKDKEILKGGFWKIRTIYTGLSQPIDNTDGEYKKHFERLNRWKEQFPDSITARVALADSWVSYASEARGGDYANTVTEQGWKLFRERLSFAEKELLEAKRIKERCPHQYLVMLDLALAQSRNLEDFDAVYQEAIESEPNYYYYYRIKAMYLLPRWNGSEGDWETYLEQSTGQMGSPDGEIVYYMVVSHFVLNIKGIPFDKTRLSWEKVRRGFYALKEKPGVERQRLNEFAKLSLLAHEYPTAGEIFAEIGDDWDKGVWRTKAAFEQQRAIPATIKKIDKQRGLRE